MSQLPTASTPPNPVIDNILDQLTADSPAFLTRTKIESITSGAIKAKTLANLDSLGTDCIPERITVGGKVCYPTPSFIKWIRGRMQVVASGVEA